MSEYQYYEFAAIDKPLTRAAMAALRAVSTRAEITATGFVNHYEWGDLKADPADWMRRYFDAFVYTADWGSCRLALRLPLAAFGKAALKPFTSSPALTAHASDRYWIVDWALDESEDYERFAEDDGRGWMRRLAPLRDELLRGDLRPLYLGWLAGADVLDDGAVEPAVPPGLATLSPPQQALAEFLEIDPDLLAAAGAASAAVSSADAATTEHVDTWLGEWPRDEMQAVLKLIALGRVHEAEREVSSRHAAWLKAQRPSPARGVPGRSVAALRELAKAAAVVRLEREAKARIKQEAACQRHREAYLRRLMTEVDQQWDAIELLAKRGNASGYDQAMRALIDLAEGYALTSASKEFERLLRDFAARHATRGALLRRLMDAGLR